MKKYDEYTIEPNVLYGKNNKDEEWTKILEINPSAFNFPATELTDIVGFLIEKQEQLITREMVGL